MQPPLNTPEQRATEGPSNSDREWQTIIFPTTSYSIPAFLQQGISFSFRQHYSPPAALLRHPPSLNARQGFPTAGSRSTPDASRRSEPRCGQRRAGPRQPARRHKRARLLPPAAPGPRTATFGTSASLRRAVSPRLTFSQRLRTWLSLSCRHSFSCSIHWSSSLAKLFSSMTALPAGTGPFALGAREGRARLRLAAQRRGRAACCAPRNGGPRPCALPPASAPACTSGPPLRLRGVSRRGVTVAARLRGGPASCPGEPLPCSCAAESQDAANTGYLGSAASLWAVALLWPNWPKRLALQTGVNNGKQMRLAASGAVRHLCGVRSPTEPPVRRRPAAVAALAWRRGETALRNRSSEALRVAQRCVPFCRGVPQHVLLLGNAE